MAEKVQIKASTRRTKSGKIVRVKAYDQNRDSVGDTLKAEGRVPVAAQPGSFPNGRSTPTTAAVARYENERQDEEVRSAQIRARMAQQELARLTEQYKGETGTVSDQTNFYSSLSDQFAALVAADAAGEGGAGGGGGSAA